MVMLMESKNNRNETRNTKNKPIGAKFVEIRAQCTEMCPDQEFDIRVKNNLVHALEKKFINSKVFYQLVKEYSRPAAGKLIRNCDLRTLETLVKSTIYLIDEVHDRKDVEYVTIYEFLFDRLRAIRQDIIIQRCEEIEAIQILETILRFYILADYKLCASKEYDEFMNYQHLSEVLFTIITSGKSENLGMYCIVYILLNLNKKNNIMRGLKLAKSLSREYYPLNDALRLLKYYNEKNYVNVFRTARKLPLMCQLALHRRVPEIEKAMIKQYNVAFSCKNSKFPVSKFVDLTLMNGPQSLQKYVKSKLIEIDAENNIVFQKKNASVEPDSKLNLRERTHVIDKALEQKHEKEVLLKSFEVRRLNLEALKI